MVDDELIENPKSEMSSTEIDHLIERLEELQSDFHEMVEVADEWGDAKLRQLAGSEFETMLQSESNTVKYFDHPNADFRKASIAIASLHWQLNGSSIAIEYERLAKTDKNSDVRDEAVRALGTFFSRTKNLRIARFFAALVRDDTLEPERRFTAFASLLRVHGNLDYGAAGGKSPLVPQTLNEIDWEFVDLYLEGGEKGGGEKGTGTFINDYLPD